MVARRFAKPPILDAIPARGHAVIEASAGTGKTYTLEHWVLALLIEHEATLDETLMVTFTERATREMRARVQRLLRAIVHPAADDPRVLQIDNTDLADKAPTETPAWRIDDAAALRLRDALTHFDRAPIYTIHSFCHRILSDHAFRSRRPFQLEATDGKTLFLASVRQTLRHVLAEKSPLQQRLYAVLEALPMGTLESTLWSWHTERGVPRPSWDIGELTARLQAVRALAYAETVSQTTRRKDTAASLLAILQELRDIATQFERDPNSVHALATIDAWRRTKQSGKTRLRWLEARLKTSPELAEALAPVIALLQSTPPLLGVLVQELLPRVREEYTRQKSRARCIDYDEMLLGVRDALRSSSGHAMRRALQRTYRFALVDEFQDTDEVQWEIFRTLFVDTNQTQASNSNPHRALFVIGDPKQSIYGFRNADVHTYLAARDHLLHGTEPVRLVDNFRSTPGVIEVYNAIFAGDFFEGPVRYDAPVRCGDTRRRALNPDETPAASLQLMHLAYMETNSKEKKKRKPSLNHARAALEDAIAREIQRLVTAEPSPLRVGANHEPPRRLRYDDVHVLTRTQREAERVAEALSARGVPHALFKQDGLFQTRAAADILRVLRAIDRPSDRAARLRAWLTPFFGVSLEQLHETERADEARPRSALLSHWRALAEARDLPRLLRALLEEGAFARRDPRERPSSRWLTNVRHILELLLEHAHAQQLSVSALSAWLDGVIQGHEEPPGEHSNHQRITGAHDAVAILTMHKAKGLEAEVVFVAGGFGPPSSAPRAPRVRHVGGVREAFMGPLLQDIQRDVQAEITQEETRLFYVALTRARARLYLPHFGPPPPEHAEVSGAPDTSLKSVALKSNAPYRVVQRRLSALIEEDHFGPSNPHVAHQLVLVSAGPLTRPLPNLSPAERETGTEQPSLLAPLPVWERGTEHRNTCKKESINFEKIREQRAGFTLTSYSRLKAQHGGYVAPAPASAEADTADTLPGGTHMGLLLHEALEHLDFARVRSQHETDFLADDNVNRLLLAAARRNGVETRWLPTVKALLFRTLRTPVTFGDVRVDGFAELEHRHAEVSFQFPWPEADHPPWSDASAVTDVGASAPAYRIQRGLVRGVIDWVFEHDGRVYILDWKSDRLPDSAPDALAAHVHANYALQAKIYTLAIRRVLAIRDPDAYSARFGGLLYVFLRAVRADAPNRGIYFERPSWKTLGSWEAQLLQESPV